MADPLVEVRLCESAALAEGGEAVRFEVWDGGAMQPAFAVRWRGQAQAYLNRCSHVAMELDWLPGRVFDGDAQFLICSTHGALYDPASGACLGGPCNGRGGLRKIELIERDGAVFWRPDRVYRERPDA
jgi:nitrite reductase/ring-hydroxylating ferredoxin subunit